MSYSDNTIMARTYALADIRDRILIHGRTGEAEGGLFFDHTTAGIEFTAYMQGEVTLSVKQKGKAYYAVWIDGVRQGDRLKADNPEFDDLCIATFAEGGVHTVRVLKACEMGVAQSVFKDLNFTGYLTQPAEKRELLIEFLGDSITSGYGNVMYTAGVGDENSSPVSAVNSDGTRAWAFLAAEKLGARSTIISDSGIGIVYEHGPVPGRRMFNFWRYNSFARQELGLFEPDEVPNLIVINLGTNDRLNKVDPEALVSGTKELVALVRDTYQKDIPIVWATGMMGGAFEEHTHRALAELGGEDNGLYIVELALIDAAGGGHPGPRGNQASADILVGFLKSENLV